MQPPANRKKDRPHFPLRADPFYQIVKEKAVAVVAAKRQPALRTTWAKTIVYPGLYVCFYLLLIGQGRRPGVFYGCYAAMGILTTFIVFNIVHDAVHHALFPVPAHNRRAMRLLDLLGGNSFVWSKRHVVFHHGYTNIPGWDIDIQQSAMVRFNNKQPFRPVYRLQFLYMPLVYLLYSLNWILRRDFMDFFSEASVVRKNFIIPRKEYHRLLIFKLFYWFYLVAVPGLLLRPSAISLISGVLLMHALMSALTLLVLLPSHLDEAAVFPEPDEQGMLPESWAIHQLKVTNDFGTDSRVLNFIMGGLNHHIAHHLFPNVNHNIIPAITEHIAATARELRLPYKNYSLRRVMTSHFRLLRKNGLSVLEE